MRRVLFRRSAIIGWPQLAADGQSIEKRPNGQPVVVRVRCYIGDEVEVPDGIAEELVKGGIAGVYHEGGLRPAADQASQPQLPPPVAPEAAFALRPVEESAPEAHISMPPPPASTGRLRDHVR